VLPAQAAAETFRLPDSGIAQAVPFADDVSTLLRNGKYRKLRPAGAPKRCSGVKKDNLQSGRWK
jgi:hypothetical protein